MVPHKLIIGVSTTAATRRLLLRGTGQTSTGVRSGFRLTGKVFDAVGLAAFTEVVRPGWPVSCNRSRRDRYNKLQSVLDAGAAGVAAIRSLKRPRNRLIDNGGPTRMNTSNNHRRRSASPSPGSTRRRCGIIGRYQDLSAFGCFATALYHRLPFKTRPAYLELFTSPRIGP